MVEHHRIGQQFGNYRLERLLGRGGFAEVYIGIHLRLQRPAAIKILHTHLSEQESAAFQREAQIIAGLNHPHIVRVLDFDVQQGIPFLVMDYLPHGTLRQRHPRGERVPLPTVLSYVKEVAQALQYAHEHRLIHRDVKPENMLIGQRGEIVLSDFGIAAIAHNTTSRTAQEAVGTAPYMAPEQIQAQARAASDQYALGVVVYEWLAGERPFEGSFTEIFAKHLMVPPPPLHVKLPTLPKAVEQVIFRVLAKEPGERFSDITAFATALQEAIEDGADRETGDKEAIVSHNPPMPHALLPTTMLKTPSIQTPSVLNTEAVSSSGPTHIQGVHSTRVSVQPSKERPIEAVPEEKKPQSRKVLRRNVIIGAGIGIVAAGAGTAWWFLSPYSLDALIYRGHSWSVTAVAWSPDGKHIASATDAINGIHVWDAATSYHLFTYTGHSKTTDADPPLTSIAWSPDGKRIASGDDKTVHVWDAADGGHPFIYQQEG
ncbi:serine/threonine protein kinase [Ktedonospora formicarum]|uniref:non-specific serine/threonine protein kinase n=1 Tax=Ktedonospora formicarum TaxID=2778364 RepID=A0A8J3I5H0_9CHLR|nr:serine/threonine-protein kinase [Ktedonospora formicarum]GHO49919.1 hypothetical protein KSX_80820 [Ktedonospora formicarum]